MSPEELYKIVTEAIKQGSVIPWWTYLLFIALPFIGSYLGSYSKKKGENLATKEDIDEITKKIESVKAEIHLSKELEKQYLDKKLDLLIMFFDHVSEFYYEMLSVNFGDFPNDEGKSLYEHQVTFHKMVADIAKSYQRLVIYISPGSQILHHAEHLTNTVLSSRQIFKKRFSMIKNTNFEEFSAFKSGDTKRIELAIEQANIANSNFWDEMTPTTDEFKEYFQKFITNLNEYVKPDSKKT